MFFFTSIKNFNDIPPEFITRFNNSLQNVTQENIQINNNCSHYNLTFGSNFALDAHVDRKDLKSRIFGVTYLRRMFQSAYTPYAIRNNRLFFELTLTSNLNFDSICRSSLYEITKSNIINDRIVAQIINNLKSKLPGLVDLIFLDSNIFSKLILPRRLEKISLRFLISTTTFLGDVDFFLKRFEEFTIVSTNNEMSNIEIRHLKSIDEINEYWNRVFDRSLTNCVDIYKDESYAYVFGNYDDSTILSRSFESFIDNSKSLCNYSPGFFYLGCWNKFLNINRNVEGFMNILPGLENRYPPLFHFSLLRFSEYYPDVRGRVVNEDSNFIPQIFQIALDAKSDYDDDILNNKRKRAILDFNSRFVFYGSKEIAYQVISPAGWFDQREVFRPTFAEIIYAVQLRAESELSSLVNTNTDLNLYDSKNNFIFKDFLSSDAITLNNRYFYAFYKSLLKQFFKLNQMIVKGEDWEKADVLIWSEKNNCYILFSSFKDLIRSKVFKENFIPYMANKGYAELVNFTSLSLDYYDFLFFSRFFFEKENYFLQDQYDYCIENFH